MRKNSLMNFSDCAEFDQALHAQPPRIVHGTACLLIALLALALGWAALTKANLVVRAPGRVRPVTLPVKVFNSGSGEVLSATFGGRVIEVKFREGEELHKGAVLIRLDAQRLENEIAKRQRTVQSGEEELANLARLVQLQTDQFETARAKALAEIAQAEEEVRQAKQRRESDIRFAEAEFRQASDEEARHRMLKQQQAISESELVKAKVQLHETREKSRKFQLPVDEGRILVLRRALELVTKEHLVRREELLMNKGAKKIEIEGARLDLANLELERQQAVLRVPMDGVVISGDVKVGDMLERGKPVLEIAEQKGFRFEAAIPSEEVGHLRLGMPVRIKLDAFDYQKYGTFPGQVQFISPDSVVVDGPDGKKRIAYVVKVGLEAEGIGGGEFRGRVKLGLAGQAEIVTGQKSILEILVKKLRRSISLG